MINLTPEFWLQTAVYLIGGACAVVAVAFRIGRTEASFVSKTELAEKVKDRNVMVDRVYQRFDDFKRIVSEEYVRKDMCGQLHVTNRDELKRIDDEYKAFRHEIRNQIQMLVDKIDQVKELIQKKG